MTTRADVLHETAMNSAEQNTTTPETPAAPAAALGDWESPSFEIISLCCEISAYSADDEPLF